MFRCPLSGRHDVAALPPSYTDNQGLRARRNDTDVPIMVCGANAGYASDRLIPRKCWVDEVSREQFVVYVIQERTRTLQSRPTANLIRRTSRAMEHEDCLIMGTTPQASTKILNPSKHAARQSSSGDGFESRGPR